MTEEDLDRLKRRFGADVSAWPAPYRQEARLFPAGAGKAPDTGEDAQLDLLILKAARLETDEQALARKVRERIGQEQRTLISFLPRPSSWQLPAAATGFAVILFAVGVAGYTIAGVSYWRMEDALLALATGDPAAGGIGSGELRAPYEWLGDEGLL